MPDLAEILHDAEERGYGQNFELDAGGLRCKSITATLGLDDVSVEDTVSVVQGSDPGDDATVLLLKTRTGEKGYLILSSPFYVDPETRDFVEALRKK